MKYRIHQITRKGERWISTVAFEGDLRHAHQNVIAGWLHGEPRWAAKDAGGFLFGVDGEGKALAESPDPLAVIERMGIAVRIRSYQKWWSVEHAPLFADGVIGEDEWGLFESGPGTKTSVYLSEAEAVTFLQDLINGRRDAP